ncbi:hypothetical protein EYZ11_003611 [Aspergillus tanneri]|uniref:N-acetyltransferase domain-containing protein n=1 Tax=Aspergillus tanneri TaxID=1220188 RepID=A0A4V3UPY4_9EURO|nr:hypothetical protein EYZ11_003611 [Aspergillus tanneri]
MPLELRPMTPYDFEFLSTEPGKSYDNFSEAIWGNPVPPAVQKWDMMHLAEPLIQQKPNVHFVKVVDTDLVSSHGEELVSWAKWIRYEDGFPYEDLDACLGDDVPEQFNGALFIDFVRALDENRRNAGIMGRPCWFLEYLFTREKHFRRGGGKMLIDWGVERAGEDRLPAYLDASPMGYSLYLRCGFRDMQSVCRVDLKRGRGVEDCVRAMIKEC